MIPIGVYTGGSSRFKPTKHNSAALRRIQSSNSPTNTPANVPSASMTEEHNLRRIDFSDHRIPMTTLSLGDRSFDNAERHLERKFYWQMHSDVKFSSSLFSKDGSNLLPTTSIERSLPPWHYEQPIRRLVPVKKKRLSVHWDPAVRDTTNVPFTQIPKDQSTPKTPATVASADTPSPGVASIKRSASIDETFIVKRSKGFEKLDMLVSASMEMGPMHEVDGCSCPKSKCIALYCECFKAGRRCDPKACSCVGCKNTASESGPDGARTRAIRAILTRNPRAFLTAGLPNQPQKLEPGENACNCVRSRCLKLYCTCFQVGKTCQEGICTCVKCENVTGSDARDKAVNAILEKRPDAFETKPRDVGAGCACKNNRCVRKYCECYRLGKKCADGVCTCNDCMNFETEH